LNLLLDTHVALWAITDDARLTARARKLITAPHAQVWVSVASLWEIAIKHALGRGSGRDVMPVSADQAWQYFLDSGYQTLDIQPAHVVQLAHLPEHHQDPFDRLLVAQALVEPMRLLTHDKTVARYSDVVVRV